MNALVATDLQHIWHPCAQMKDYAIYPPSEVIRAHGALIELKDGKKLIDAISSWWCKSLGHGHPRIKKAVLEQIEKFEHVLFAHTTNQVIVELSAMLTQLMPTLKKVFYAGDGSCAVEIAMKMSWHARKMTGQNQRNLFVALENSYHGETLGALSVSDVGLYRKPYEELLIPTHFISHIPYVTGKDDPLWNDCADYWQATEKMLEPISERISAVLVEPILQGGGGMKIYSQDWLSRLRMWTRERGIHLIADEIMTGLGRTGKMLACEHAQIEPDFLCLGKGLTSGWMPFSAVLTGDELYEIFYADYGEENSFLHSHTYSGHVLGAAAAREVLRIFADTDVLSSAEQHGQLMHQQMIALAEETGRLHHVRRIGAMAAADADIYSGSPRFAIQFGRRAAELGVLLRPLGNTIYWLPPLTINAEQLEKIKRVTGAVVKELFLTQKS